LGVPVRLVIIALGLVFEPPVLICSVFAFLGFFVLVGPVSFVYEHFRLTSVSIRLPRSVGCIVLAIGIRTVFGRVRVVVLALGFVVVGPR
jgi:hypothetical protein